MNAVAPVVVQRSDGWASITLNRPAKRNAITADLARQLSDALVELDDDADVRAILLAGAGGSFCSGMDLGDRRSTDADGAPSTEPQAEWTDVHATLLARRTPIVAALERFAINAGAALALAADLVVAGDDAFMQVSEISMGIGAPMCQMWLQRQHPGGTARRLVLLGDRVPATDLAAVGVVTSVVPPDQVFDTARAVATRIAAHPPSGVDAIQRVNRLLDPPPADRGAARDALQALARPSAGDTTEVPVW